MPSYYIHYSYSRLHLSSSNFKKSMATHIHAATRDLVEEDNEFDDEEEDEEKSVATDEENDLKRKRLNLAKVLVKRGSNSDGAGGVAQPCCQVEKCGADLTYAKKYHKRHKVCEGHAKAPIVLFAGLRQRFCQQCSRFHDLSEFDGTKKSCRRRLAGHNERRRKTTLGAKPEDRERRQTNGEFRPQITFSSSNSSFKNYQIR